MGIVQIVRRADGEVVDIDTLGFHMVVMSVEEFLLGKKRGTGKIAVDNTYRIALVIRRYQLVACLLDGLQVTRSDISANPNKCKILHIFFKQTVTLSVQ